MKERAFVVGETPALVAVLTEPPDDSATADRPACILLNAGLVHRVGPNRLYVRLARALAAAGYRTLRLDLSGRGDSDVRRDGLSFMDGTVREVSSVMDHLEKMGSRQFILLGICSGGIGALHTGIVDSRVAGCVAIDGPAYPTRGYYLRYYGRRLWNPETWRNTLSGKNAIGRLLRGGQSRSAGNASLTANAEDEFGNLYGDTKMPSRSEAAETLKRVVARGTRLLFIFSGSWKIYNYRRQFADAFPFVDQGGVRVEYFPSSDHTFARLYNQKRFVDTICGWVTAEWPASRSVRSEARQTVSL